jgi:hypothetical protein
MAQNPGALTNRPALRAAELDRMQQGAHALRSAIARDVFELEGRLRKAFNPRLQIAKHPFVAAAVVLGGVFAATKFVQLLLRRVRTPEAGKPRRRCATESLAFAYASGRSAGVREANLKEARE